MRISLICALSLVACAPAASPPSPTPTPSATHLDELPVPPETAEPEPPAPPPANVEHITLRATTQSSGLVLIEGMIVEKKKSFRVLESDSAKCTLTPHPAGLEIKCGVSEMTREIELGEGLLSVVPRLRERGEKTAIDIDARDSFELPTAVEFHAPPPRCPADAKPSVHHAALRRDDKSGEIDLVGAPVAEPVPVLFAPHPSRCWTVRMLKGTQIRTTCVVGGAANAHVWTRDSTLFVSQHVSSHSEPDSGAVAAYPMECGATLDIERFTVHDVGYSAFSMGPCMDACAEGSLKCANACVEQHADEDGNADPEGQRCVETCQERAAGCGDHCEATRARSPHGK